MTDKIPMDLEALCRKWVHSSEEDTKEETVYRPADFPFPPSRGRAAFELGRDKAFKCAAIGPTDISSVGEGRWELERDEQGVRIRVECDGVHDVITIKSVGHDRLTISKENA